MTAAHSVSKVPENGNGTDMKPAMDAAWFLLKVENKEDSMNKETVAAREKEAKATKRTAKSMIAACRVPTLCSNQTETSEASPEEAVSVKPTCQQV